MSKKQIDLKDSLVGHVILWAKGWYHEQNQPRTLERLNEVVNQITGMPEDHLVNVRDFLSFMMEAAFIFEINPRQIAESIARETAFSSVNKRLTSYHVELSDTISMTDLLNVYAGLISCGQIKTDKEILVLLPELNEVIRKKYQLERFLNHDF